MAYRLPETECLMADIGNSPTYKRGLALEEIDFFSLNNNEQFECLVEFLRRANDDYQLETVDS